jgi:hypothetical protein
MEGILFFNPLEEAFVPEFISEKYLTLKSSIKLYMIRVKYKRYDRLNPMWISPTVFHAVYQKSYIVVQCYGLRTSKYDLSRRFCSTQKLCLSPGVSCIEEKTEEPNSVIMDGRRTNPSPADWEPAVMFIENALSVL